MARGLLWLAALTACLMLGFCAYMLFLDGRSRPLEAPLAKLLPASFDEWTSADQPISESEEMQSRVATILKYDDVLARNYAGPGLAISLYVGYWNPGKAPVSDVGVHTPDSCWVYNGWNCIERESNQNRTVRGQPLKPFEYGAYTKDGHTQYVIFWHLVGDWTSHMRYDGWTGGLAGRWERLPLLFKSFERFGLNQRREQFFIRMSCARPFSELWNNPQFLDFIEQMRPLRIFEPTPNP